MTYYVFYNDDGGKGLKVFNTKTGVENFIEQRMNQKPMERRVDNYTVILGTQIGVEVAHSAISVKVGE